MKGYDVALGNDIEALVADVERLADLGYEPQGGIAISESYGRMAQAMVKRSGPPVTGPSPGPEPDPATVTLYPAKATVPPRGGSGSVNVTITSPGTWEVTAIPDWVTITPMGPQTEDVQIVYTGAANTTGAPRSAVLEVNTATLTLNQGA